MQNYLTGWKEIAKSFGVTVRTVKTWHYKFSMPVKRLPSGRRYAVKKEIECWLDECAKKKYCRFPHNFTNISP